MITPIKDEYLQNFIVKYPDNLKAVIRNFLFTSSLEETNCLVYIGRTIEFKQIEEVVAGLSDKEREQWKFVQKVSVVLDIPKVRHFLNAKLVASLATTQPLMDNESWEIIMRMRHEDVPRFCEKFRLEGAILLNVLNTKFLVKVMNSIPPEKSIALMEQGGECGSAISKEDAKKLREALVSFSSEMRSQLFSMKILKVLDVIDYSKEKVIYSNLLDSYQESELVEVATANFPMNVLWHLPQKCQADIIQSLPVNKKAAFFCTLEESQRQSLIESSMAKGTNARDMLDMEMERLTANDIEYKKCQLQKNQIWKEFTSFIREHIKNNPDVVGDIQEGCRHWLSEIKKVASGKIRTV